MPLKLLRVVPTPGLSKKYAAAVGREQEPGPQHGDIQAALPVAVSPQT